MGAPTREGAGPVRDQCASGRGPQWQRDDYARLDRIPVRLTTKVLYWYPNNRPTIRCTEPCVRDMRGCVPVICTKSNETRPRGGCRRETLTATQNRARRFTSKLRSNEATTKLPISCVNTCIFQPEGTGSTQGRVPGPCQCWHQGSVLWRWEDVCAGHGLWSIKAWMDQTSWVVLTGCQILPLCVELV